MQYRYLGKSGLQVSALSLGSWLTFGKQIEDDMAERLMHIAYDHGVNFFDNAEIYARGQSEIVMGKILKKANWERSSYVVSSKVFFGDGGKKPNQTGLSRKHIFEACDAALRRLQVDYLDLFFCHRPDKNTPIAETVWAMNHLIQKGKILYWGTSEWSAQEIMAAHTEAARLNLIGPTMEQPQYNMFHRKKVEVDFNEIYKHYGLGTTIWSPLSSGLLTGKYLDGMPKEDTRLKMEGLEWLKDSVLREEYLEKVRQLKTVADKLETSLPKFALAWCLKNPHVSTVILGASKEHHLKENLASLEILDKWNEEIDAEVEKILDNKPEESVF